MIVDQSSVQTTFHFYFMQPLYFQEVNHWVNMYAVYLTNKEPIICFLVAYGCSFLITVLCLLQLLTVDAVNLEFTFRALTEQIELCFANIGCKIDSLRKLYIGKLHNEWVTI